MSACDVERHGKTITSTQTDIFTLTFRSLPAKDTELSSVVN